MLYKAIGSSTFVYAGTIPPQFKRRSESLTLRAISYILSRLSNAQDSLGTTFWREVYLSLRNHSVFIENFLDGQETQYLRQPLSNSVDNGKSRLWLPEVSVSDGYENVQQSAATFSQTRKI